jgi:hypothetical protein
MDKYMNYRQMRLDRLDVLGEWLRDELMVSWKDVPKALRDAGIVTVYYTQRCLLMDIWFLKRTYLAPIGKNSSEIDFDHTKLRFQIILRCLLDMQIGRPCDLNTWKGDMPSDSCRCTNDLHICYEDAERYLMNVCDEEEYECGLPSGKLRDLIKAIKKDPIFSIGSILTSDAPSSFVALRRSDLLPRKQTSTYLSM